MALTFPIPGFQVNFVAGAKRKKVVLAASLVMLAAVVVLWLLPESLIATKLPAGPVTPAVSLGETHALILAPDGSLWSWGTSFLGWPVLGLSNVAYRVQPTRIGHDTNWVGISAACEHNLALKSDGTIWAWGENTSDELGDGTKAKMRMVPVRSVPGNDWRQVSTGAYSSFALKKNGTLWAWGMNWAGELGIGITNRSCAKAMQVGQSTNWVKVWAGWLAVVGQQSDGTLWYWGENPNPSVAPATHQIVIPTRVGADSNWVDVGFGTDDTVFAIKSDGSLWAWGRQAHAYTGVMNQDLDVSPVRIGADSDWRGISACGNWWCQGLTKKDGSLWLMDASCGLPNGPRPPFGPPKFRRIGLKKDYVAFIAGAAHDAPPGVHIPVGVVVTRDSEIWTWGMVLGSAHLEPWQERLQAILRRIHPVDFSANSQTRPLPWQLAPEDK